MIGKKFGKLLVIAKTQSYKYINRKTGRQTSRNQWECLCDCGNKVIKSTGGLNSSSSRGKNQQCSDCAYKSRPQSQRRLTSIERMFNVRVKNHAEKYREISVEITADDFYKVAQQNCYYCGIEAPDVQVYKNKFSKSETLKIHGLDRIDSNLGYTLDNIVSCCKICNTMKSVLSQDEFFKHIKNIITFTEKKRGSNGY